MSGALAGLVFGIGLVLAWFSVGVRTPLASVWEPRGRSEDQWSFGLNSDGETTSGSGAQRWLDQRWRGLDSRLDSHGVEALLRDSGLAAALAVTGGHRGEFVGETVVKLVAAAAMFTTVLSVGTDRLGGFGPQTCLAGIGVGFIVAAAEIKSLRSRAEERRAEMLQALAAFMEFTRLAAQTQGVEASMRSASAMGATWPFRVLDRVFAQADRQREQPWVGLVALGQQFAMPELVELGGALASAGREGTQVRDMLSAKSVSLRRRLTEIEISAAESQTAAIAVPLGGIGLVAMTLLVVPALLALT